MREQKSTNKIIEEMTVEEKLRMVGGITSMGMPDCE